MPLPAPLGYKWTMPVKERVDPSEPVDAREYLAAQPPPHRIEGALERIQALVAESGRHVAVVDDDPTGSQTVHGVPLLTTWGREDLEWALDQPSGTFFVLTNSRSLGPDEAAQLNRDIAERLADIGKPVAVTSRSDSTMRGYFPLETDVLRAGLGVEVDGVVLCPCFIEPGRLTAGDVQWVRQGEQLVPSAQTEFARDRSFGYAHSNLALWVEEKTEGAVPASEVASMTLADLREGGPDRVAALLSEMTGARPLVVNATEYSDLECFVLGLLAAEAAGKRFIYRTGPSFVRVRGGISESPPLTPEVLYATRPRQGHGLVVVGSHVDMTTRQLEAARALERVHAIELSVPRLLDDDGRAGELDSVVEEAGRALGGEEVLVYTSRELAPADAGRSALDVGRSVSAALVEVVRRVAAEHPLGFVVAKGGITSSDVGTRGLGVRRAEIAGQMLPGIIPVWRLPEGSDHAGMPYVVFPGNVGDEGTLAQVIEILRGDG